MCTFIYADDILLAASHSILQPMLTICDHYASRNLLIFNPTKTKCIFFPTNMNMKQFPITVNSEKLSMLQNVVF